MIILYLFYKNKRTIIKRTLQNDLTNEKNDMCILFFNYSFFCIQRRFKYLTFDTMKPHPQRIKYLIRMDRMYWRLTVNRGGGQYK